MIVPVGGGSGICGISLVARYLNPAVEIIGVQSESAPVCHRAYGNSSGSTWKLPWPRGTRG